jgi:ycfA family protein
LGAVYCLGYPFFILYKYLIYVLTYVIIILLGGYMSSKEIIKMLEADGWILRAVEGSHHHFKHPSKKGKVTVPHPNKDLHIKTVNSILKQAGLK